MSDKEKLKAILNYINDIIEENEELFKKNISDKETLERALQINEDRKNLMNDSLDLMVERDKYKSIVDGIKEEIKLAMNELQYNELVNGKAMLNGVLNVLKELEEGNSNGS